MLNLTKRVDYGLIALTHLACVEKAEPTATNGAARLSVRAKAVPMAPDPMIPTVI